jgi:peptide/nickel transport system ATP-binding protein
MALLQVNQLSISFTTEGVTTLAVKEVSFSIAPGETLAIVGESGSGKSITSLSLLQLLPDTAKVKGTLLFTPGNATPIDLVSADSNTMRRIRGKDIAMIFQEPMTSLNPVFTCGSQVIEAIRLHQKADAATARQRALELFTKVQLPNPEQMLDRYPHEISGGQKQRVMIAMAICCNPALLIADEPTTALDVTVQRTILQLLKDLQTESGMGMIFITHDLGVVADIADKILVLYKGDIVEQGSAKQVLQHPQHPYTRALLACRPAIHPKGQRLPVVSDFLQPETRSTRIVQPITVSQQPTTTPILRVEEVSVQYATRKKGASAFFKAVDDVSFVVNKGDIIGLVGESGCGKTTLGRAILQLAPVSTGRILLEGRDIASIKGVELRQVRQNLQIVFQDPYGSLNPRISIGSAILEPLRVHHPHERASQQREKVIALLEKVNLQADHYNRYPHQFSGGQRQRICIARALALNPSFLVFDESVSALDVSVQAQVLNLINDLKNELGFTAIFISHDLSVVRYLCNTILVMRKGKIVERGDAESIYRHPQDAYTRHLLEAIPGKDLLTSSS